VQGLTIIGGVVGSVIAIVFAARRAEKTGVVGRAMPHLLLAFVFGLGLMYCLLGRAVKPPAAAGAAAPAAITQPADAPAPAAKPLDAPPPAATAAPRDTSTPGAKPIAK
jgi:pyruvate/2-oxoglutarate dehydrogenase complex dihydrolipoamide acyltransferase (E2) component